VTVQIYVWAEPRDIDASRATELVRDWLATGGDPSQSPFAPTTDVAWFHRELTKDLPDIDTVSDGARNVNRRPIFLETDDPEPARVVAIRLPADTSRDVLTEIYSLAVKYDLVVFNPERGDLRRPMDEMAAYASATFWPSGAIRALVAGGIAAVLTLAAWFLNIPILSGIVIIIGVFMVVLTILTFVSEGRKRLRSGTRT
jgi:hypothetical protein